MNRCTNKMCEDNQNMEAVERKKKFIIDVVYAALVLVLFYFFMKYAFGLFLPFLCAFLVAMMLQKPVNIICKKTPLKRGIVSVALVLFFVTVVLGILVGLILRLGVEVKGFFNYILIQLQDLPAFVKNFENFVSSHLSFLPDKLEHTVTSFISEKEYRLVSLPYNVNEYLGQPHFYVEETNIKKYYILNLKNVCKKLGIHYCDLFEEICIGPQARVTKDLLSDYFASNGVSELCPKIRLSDCPLRRF